MLCEAAVPLRISICGDKAIAVGILADWLPVYGVPNLVEPV